MLFSRLISTSFRLNQFRSASSFHTPTTITDVDPVTNDELAGISLQISVLLDKYKKQEIAPHAFFKSLTDKIEATKSNNAWTMIPPQDHVLGQALALEREFAKDPVGVFQRKPLFGIPFSVKDNYDVAGYPTTSGCPKFAFTPWKTSFAIQKLIDAGAILVGRCNMDQFATGLVGVRSPYGTPVNPFNPNYCPGGSSSGSGVAVSTGLCSFSIGTDTAGSGRIPASFTNIVGCKPTPGLVSTGGMFPACRSLDCFSIFGLSVDDTWKVLQLAKGFDPDDEYSKPEPNYWHVEANLPKDRKPRFGVPKGAGLAFFGDTNGTRELFDSAKKRIESITGGEFVEVDFTPFTEVARILYEGPWVAQRLSALKEFFARTEGTDAVLPVTRNIIAKGSDFSAVDLFIAERRLEHLRRAAQQAWKNADIDILVTPTASITPTIAEVNALPVGINTVLGYYTNYVNLLNLSALAVPNGFLPSGMPTGITLVGQAWQDRSLAVLGRAFQQSTDLNLGATNFKLAPSKEFEPVSAPVTFTGQKIPIVVVGAHLSGMPLNTQLTDLKGTLVSSTKTAPKYKLFDVSKSAKEIPRPGLVHVGDDASGNSYEVEVWNLPAEVYGKFLDNVKPPLAIGNVVLSDGSVVKGFVAEAYGIQGAKDISDFSGWRAYMASKNKK